MAIPPNVRDLKIDPETGDLCLNGSDLAFVTTDTNNGKDAITQAVRTRLRTFAGEWFLDPAVGVPYFQSVFVKNPDLTLVREAFRQTLLNTPGVVSVDALILNFTGKTRQLGVSFVVATDAGQLVPFVETVSV